MNILIYRTILRAKFDSRIVEEVDFTASAKEVSY
jgi:hypothetical protein